MNKMYHNYSYDFSYIAIYYKENVRMHVNSHNQSGMLACKGGWFVSVVLSYMLIFNIKYVFSKAGK